jgi:hypothetical protein
MFLENVDSWNHMKGDIGDNLHARARKKKIILGSNSNRIAVDSSINQSINPIHQLINVNITLNTIRGIVIQLESCTVLSLSFSPVDVLHSSCRQTPYQTE